MEKVRGKGSGKGKKGNKREGRKRGAEGNEKKGREEMRSIGLKECATTPSCKHSFVIEH